MAQPSTEAISVFSTAWPRNSMFHQVKKRGASLARISQARHGSETRALTRNSQRPSSQSSVEAMMVSTM
jgi:lambda repressor-like predicted transcriptional regulator